MTQTPKPLTTAEHAHLLGLQQAVESALRERDAFVRFLGNQHGVTAAEWSLDVGAGQWQPVEQKTPVTIDGG